MLFQIQSYLKFLWYSKNEHAVHSPFVFLLLTKCFYDKKSKSDYDTLKKYRQSLLDNKNQIEVKDRGAGSKVFKSNYREVAKIAKVAGITAKRSQLLYKISAYFEAENILELGTSLGLSAVALALGNPKAKIFTIEACNQSLPLAQKQFELFGIKNIETINATFDHFLQTQPLETVRYQLVYFDGNHSKKETLEYFESLLPTIENDTVWIFDDIHWSADMESAWETIQNHPKVKVTIDTYQWGLVFFRYEQPKQHFVIRV